MGIILELVSPATPGEDFEASAFVMHNRSPFSAIIGLPGRWPDGTDKTAELSWNISSHSFFDTDGTESLLLDGETQTISARLQHRFWPRLQIGVNIPWIKHSGGFLDGVIDAWHNVTGLSEGVRPQFANNQLQHVFRINGSESFRLDSSTSGIGDIGASFAIDLGRLGKPATAGYLSRMPWTLKLSAEAPTGDLDKLTGNGDWDWAAGLGVRSPRAAVSRLSWWVDAGLAWPGDVDIAGLDTSGRIFFYDVALAWRIFRRFDVLAQVAGNTAFYQSDIGMIGEPATELAFGFLWHLAENYGLRFGVTEDIGPQTAPDVGFEMTLIFKSFGGN